MKVLGLIVEYNPLHYGHIHHFTQAKAITQSDACIAVMSGHFLQRGEPSIVDKFTRTKMALHMGVDLVIELPTTHALQPADGFAYGAVSLLHACGIVDSICFGSEEGKLSKLIEASEHLAAPPSSFQLLLQQYLKLGLAYPVAFQRVFSELFPHLKDTFQKPNNTLGIYYLLALKKLSSAIMPYTIPRIQAAYSETVLHEHSSIASATALRKALYTSNYDFELLRQYVPPFTISLLKEQFEQNKLRTWNDFFPYLLYQLTLSSAPQLSNYYEVTEGLEHRLKSIKYGTNFSDLISSLKTKRYPLTKLQRMLAHILLQHPSHIFQNYRHTSPEYLRVLGFNNTGQILLKKMKKTATLPILSTPKQAYPFASDWYDLIANQIYSLGSYKQQEAPIILNC